MPIEDVTDLDWYLDNVVVPAGIEHRRVGPVLAWQGSWNHLANQIRTSADDSAVGDALRLALRQGFVVSRAQARSCGVPDAAVRSLMRRGQWTACGHGTVAVVAGVSASQQHAPHDLLCRRHALRAATAALQRCNHVVGTASAAILHGLPTLGVPPLPELLTTAPATFGRRATAHVRRSDLGPTDLDGWFGTLTTAPARTIVDLARFDPRSGLMAADAALRERVSSPGRTSSASSRSPKTCAACGEPARC